MNGFLYALIAFSPLCLALAAEPVSSVFEESRLENMIIDQIELNGVTAFTQSDLEKVLELAPGDRLERKKIVQTAQNLQELYRVHGYEQVRVQTRLNQKAQQRGAALENVLEISVSEGLPTRLARIRVRASDPKWQKRVEELTSRFGLSSGEVFDQEKLANGYRAFQDAIASHDFMGVRVSEEEVVTVPGDPSRFEKALLDRAARWIEVRVKVGLGERVSFGFRGNQLFTSAELMAMVEEQRLLGFSQDYQARIQTRIVEEYRKNAYDKVSVTAYTFESEDHQQRHITYEIEEGPRVELGEVRFDGNVAFSSDTLVDIFHEKASLLVQRGYYVEKDVVHTAELVIEWMKSQGYLAAKLISTSKSFTPKEDRADVLFYIFEGEQTIVSAVDFLNLSVFTPEQLKAALKNREKQPLSLYDLGEGLETIKVMYRNQGYLDFRIVNEGTSDLVRYSDENRVAEISIALDEGVQYRISKIDITGLKKTKPEVVMRELLLEKGAVLEEDKWLASETRLRRLGIFATVTIKAHSDPAQKTGKILQVVVEEGTPGLIAGGVGIRNDLGGRVFGQIAYSNLWGKNHTVSLTGSANRRYGELGAEFCPSATQRIEDANKDHCFIEFSTELAYAFPWALLGETTFRPRISFDRIQYREFDAKTVGLGLVLQRRLASKPNLQGVLTYSLERVKQFDTNDVAEERRLMIGSFTPALILDMRDSPVAPTKGIYSTLSYELARPEFLAQIDPEPVAYSRTQYRLDGYVPLPKRIGLFLSFRTGLAYNFAKPPAGLSETDPAYRRYSIPAIKQFALGGAGSIRGFREQSLNLGDIDVLGYMSYVNYRAQIDLPFTDAMSFGPFIDVANLSKDTYSMTNDLRYGIGAGLHYRSPVGSVNFDIGVNPEPRNRRVGSRLEREDEYQLHFSIGTI